MSDTTETTFKITHNFIIDLLLKYYKGDNSLKNPLKMFIENESFDIEICREVMNGLKTGPNLFFYADLWLNDSTRYMIPGNAVSNTKNFIVQILSNDSRGLKRKMMDSVIYNFNDAHLSLSDFDWLKDWGDFDLNISTDGKPAHIDEIDVKLLAHKDYPIARKTYAYDRTKIIDFLPKTVKDIFIF